MKTIKLPYWDELPDNFTGIIEWSNGNKSWRLNGELHREDGPAIEWKSGTKSWYLDGGLCSENDYKTEMMGRSSTLGRLILNGDYFTIKGEK